MKLDIILIAAAAACLIILPSFSNATDDSPSNTTVELDVNKNATTRTLVDGDIVLTPDQQIMREIASKANTEYKSLGGPQALVIDYDQYNWPNGEVPYALSAQANSDAATRNAILAAIADYEELTCIRFKARTTESDYVYFFKGDGCWSYIGRVGGRQEISIGNRCETKGIVMHEIFHALGRWHEQSRPDRDQYVQIHTANILTGAEPNFEIVETSSVIHTQSIPYDTGSVMHYPAYAFSNNGQPTITLRDTSKSLSSLGQRLGLSASDIQHVQKLYCGGVPTGSWSAWSAWGSCTLTCNSGSQSRTRTCVGGTGCTGTNIETRACNTNACPVQPTWGTWSNWGGCTVTCGTGRQSRTRSCINSNACVGASMEYRNCSTTECPTPATWSTWTAWGACSSTCNGGIRTRTRRCLHGSTCPGESTEVGSCNTEVSCTPSPSNGEWGQWSSCSASCGGGTRTRRRQCGLTDTTSCQTATEPCNTRDCPLRGVAHKGCYLIPQFTRNLVLLEGKTPDLSDNPFVRTNAIEKCGDGARMFHFILFSLTVGFCISGSNSTTDYLTFSGTFCNQGIGGYYRQGDTFYYYMDVYEIIQPQSFAASLDFILRNITTPSPPLSTVVAPTPTSTPPTVDPDEVVSGGSFSLPGVVSISIALVMAFVFAVLL